MSEIIETGITWDHDYGTVVVSTRSQAVANRLRALSFEPDDPKSKDYLTFRADESDLKVRFARSRPSTDAQKEARKVSFAKLQEDLRVRKASVNSDQKGPSNRQGGR